MNTQPHFPAQSSADEQMLAAPKQVGYSSSSERSHLSLTSVSKWLTRFIAFTLLIGMVIGGYTLIARLLTPQVISALTVIFGIVALIVVVRLVLKIALTIIRWLILLAVVATLLLALL